MPTFAQGGARLGGQFVTGLTVDGARIDDAVWAAYLPELGERVIVVSYKEGWYITVTEWVE